ncbi:17040_t:CDS:2, partial [Gigaspora margarita]
TGYICTRALPGFGKWNKIAPGQIDKIAKQHTFERPSPNYTTHTQPSKSWTVPIVLKKVLEVEREQIEKMDIDPISSKRYILILQLSDIVPLKHSSYTLRFISTLSSIYKTS